MPKPQRRTTRRLARLRVDNPYALPGIKADNRYSPRERRQVRGAVRALNKAQADKRRATRTKAAKQYNPLAPLTGERMRQEEAAATRLEFGPREQALRNELASRDQTASERSAAYDEYRQMLRESTARINEQNRVGVETAQGRVDTAFSQDKAAVAARDAAASEQAQKLGRGPVSSEEGARAVEAQRTAGNEAVVGLQRQGQADSTYSMMREVRAAQGKLEDVGRQGALRQKTIGEQKNLAKEKGDFRVNYEDKARSSEREWAAVQQEFGIKEKDLAIKAAGQRSDAKAKAQSAAAQKIVARLYSDASKAKARATIRVAELQLKKGKIDQKQMRTIRNIYEGLPGGGSHNRPDAGTKSSGGQKLQTWERDKVSNAINILTQHKAKSSDRAIWMRRMQNEGVPARLARIAWQRYVARYGGGGSGTRPDTAGNPNVSK